MNIVELTRSEKGFAHTFGAESWDPWRDVLAATFGLPIADQALFTKCTGRSKSPDAQVRELWAIIGRRGGKSRIAALIAVYLALLRKYDVAPGEVPIIMIIATDKRQARVVKRYVSGLLRSHPVIGDACITREQPGVIECSTGVHIEIHTSDFRSVRGYTVVAAILDEIAFWPTEDRYASPDSEILNALRPAMATTPNALLVAISSPYARRGELYRAWKERRDDTLVWQADTRTMNPTLSPSVIERAYIEDASRAAAEYGAQFRSDI